MQVWVNNPLCLEEILESENMVSVFFSEIQIHSWEMFTLV